MRRRRILYAGLVFVCLWLLGSEVSVHASEPTADVEVFVRAGCPHCEAAKAFLRELRQRRPALHILVRDVGQDQTALTRLETLARRQAVTLIGVPAFYLQGELIIGYQDAGTTGARLLALLDRAAPSLDSEPLSAYRPTQPACSTPADHTSAGEDSILLPWFGRLSYPDIGPPSSRWPSGFSTASIPARCGCCCFSCRSWSHCRTASRCRSWPAPSSW